MLLTINIIISVNVIKTSFIRKIYLKKLQTYQIIKNTFDRLSIFEQDKTIFCLSLIICLVVGFFYENIFNVSVLLEVIPDLILGDRVHQITDINLVAYFRHIFVLSHGLYIDLVISYSAGLILFVYC